MAFEEKRAWILAVVSVCGYAVYLIVILGRTGGGALAEVPYVAPLLWTAGGACVAAILITIAAGVAAPRDADKKDQRDREISRFGQYVGQSFVVIGGVAALIMAMVELEHFWIANVLYLCFTLSAILESVAKIAAYHNYFQSW